MFRYFIISSRSSQHHLRRALASSALLSSHSRTSLNPLLCPRPHIYAFLTPQHLSELKRSYMTTTNEDLVKKLIEKVTLEGGAYMKLRDVKDRKASPNLPLSLPPCGKDEISHLDEVTELKEYNLYRLKHHRDDHIRFIDFLIVHQNTLTLIQHKPMQVDLAKLQNLIVTHHDKFMKHNIKAVHVLGLVHAIELDSNPFKYDPPLWIKIEKGLDLRFSYYLACFEDDFNKLQDTLK